MKANLAHGRIAGLPATGGYVTLEQADATSLVNATTGLLREGVNAGLKVGAIALGMYVLLDMLGRSAEKKKEREQERLQNPPLPMGGICKVDCYPSTYFGICLETEIVFNFAGGSMKVPIEQVIGIKRITENHMFGVDHLVLDLVDGSTFRNIYFPKKIFRFATIAGISEVGINDKRGLEIEGINLKESELIRGRLRQHLTKTRASLIEEFGLDLVRKYFHVQMEEPKQPLALPSTTQAGARLEVVIMEISKSQRIATRTLPEGKTWTVAFGEAQGGADIIFGKVENVAPYSFRLLSQAGCLCITGTNVQVTSLLVDGKKSTAPLIQAGDEWVLDCQKQSHVVVVNGHCMLHVCPRSQ